MSGQILNVRSELTSPISSHVYGSIGICGVNTFSKDQYFTHGRKIQPLLELLSDETEVITTDQHGGVDLWARMYRHSKKQSFERLINRGNLANKRLVTLSDAVFFFWDGKHIGLQRTMLECERQGKPYWVVEVDFCSQTSGIRPSYSDPFRIPA